MFITEENIQKYLDPVQVSHADLLACYAKWSGVYFHSASHAYKILLLRMQADVVELQKLVVQYFERLQKYEGNCVDGQTDGVIYRRCTFCGCYEDVVPAKDALALTQTTDLVCALCKPIRMVLPWSFYKPPDLQQTKKES